jgi:hypothetical protein
MSTFTHLNKNYVDEEFISPMSFVDKLSKANLSMMDCLNLKGEASDLSV